MIIDLVRKNRSYRGYDHSRKVTEEELRSFVEAARLCPSSVNVQPLKYFLACEEPVEMVARTCRGCGSQFTFPSTVKHWPHYCRECQAKRNK